MIIDQYSLETILYLYIQNVNSFDLNKLSSAFQWQEIELSFEMIIG